MATRTIVCIVCDSLGVGAAPDAAAFGDAGADTLGHAAAAVGGLRLPNLGAIGIGHLTTVEGVAPACPPAWSPHGPALGRQGHDHGALGDDGRHRPEARRRPYPDGFPHDVIDGIQRRIGRKALGNQPASGTVIIDELGDEHVVPASRASPPRATRCSRWRPTRTSCRWKNSTQLAPEAREQLRGEHAVGRSSPGRSSDRGRPLPDDERRDYALPPTGATVVERAPGRGVRTLGLGKIDDIFSGAGSTTPDPHRSQLEPPWTPPSTPEAPESDARSCSRTSSISTATSAIATTPSATPGPGAARRRLPEAAGRSSARTTGLPHRRPRLRSDGVSAPTTPASTPRCWPGARGGTAGRVLPDRTTFAGVMSKSCGAPSTICSTSRPVGASTKERNCCGGLASRAPASATRPAADGSPWSPTSQRPGPGRTRSRPSRPGRAVSGGGHRLRPPPGAPGRVRRDC